MAEATGATTPLRVHVPEHCHHEGSPCIPVRPPRALPTTSSHPHHAASQKRPPRVETGKTGALQSISKAVRGLPIVERRGSIVPAPSFGKMDFHVIFENASKNENHKSKAEK